VGISLGVLLVAIGVSALQIRSNWREEPPPVWVQQTERTFCTPVVMTGFFKRWMRRKLDRNPIGWLQQRTWMGRLVTWSWFAVIASIYSAVLTDVGFFRHSNHMQATMGWFLMGSIAASVVGSFRRERENGVLELLLVSPMATRKLIGGRLRGIWGQFLPATAILIGVWFYFVRIFHDFEDVPLMLYFLSTYLTLPVIGLYFSLASRSFIGAFLGTLAAGVLVPSIFPLVMMFLFSLQSTMQISNDLVTGYALAILTQMLLAGAFILLLNWRLQRRNFPFNRALA
jgi:ABC-type transport system involved in cytochrome c biogenesis permease component